MKKRWFVLLAMLLCIGCFSPLRAQAAQQPVLSMEEDCLTGEVFCYYYDDQGNVVRRTDNIGHMEVYSYYSDGVLKSTLQYSQNKPIRFTRFDAYGNVQMIQNWYEDGVIRRQTYQNTYDDQGRLLEVRYLDSLRVDEQGMSVTKYVYNEDDAGYMTEFHAYYQETDESPYRTRFTYYDAEGRLLGDEDYYLELGEGTVVSNFYDESGTLTYETRMRYDQNSQETRETTYTNRFGTAGLLQEREAVTVITTQSYQDGDSQTRSETILHKYQYDSDGRLIREDFFDGSGAEMGYETWTYDAYGNLLDRSFAGRPLEHYEYAPLSEVLWKNQK